MVIITEWDQANQREILKSIPDDKDWISYRKNWEPTWQLRNTKVLDVNLQNHTDLQNLVPEIRVYPKGSRWIHGMVYTRSMRAAWEAEESLS